MGGESALLELVEVSTHLRSSRGVVRALDGVSMTIRPGEAVGLVGESGSGKSMTALSIMGLVPKPAGRIVSGQICFEGTDLRQFSERAMQNVRGRQIAMIFQDPSSFLNPVMSVSTQLGELIAFHQRGRDVQGRIDELLALVGLPAVHRVADRYPHELSGGMKQRVLIAMALASQPKLLIADEPTTALDVTLQAQILDLLKDLRARFNMAMLLITHDLGVVSETCDTVYVMYGGKIMEHASAQTFFAAPSHPYSQGLLRAVRSLERGEEEPYSIPGVVPDLANPPSGCTFHSRCPMGDRSNCVDVIPEPRILASGSVVACHWADEEEDRGTDGH